MRWVFRAIVLAVVAAAAASLFIGRRDGTINVVGSTSVQPFAEILAQEFHHKQYQIDVQGGGSTQGILSVREGVAEVGMCSRELKNDEAAEFRGIPIALDGLAVVVHPSNPITGLTRAELRDVFRGVITDWAQLGGQPGPIRVITREEGSGTREAFAKLVMESRESGGAGRPPAENRVSRRALTQESNGSVMELVRRDRLAIGYGSLGRVIEDNTAKGEVQLKIISVDGVYPEFQAVIDRQYPLVRPFLFVVRDPIGPGAQAFIEFVLSPAGQDILAAEGLVRIR